MHVRTDLKAGQSQASQAVSPENIYSSAMELYATANQVIDNSLVDPGAFKLFMNFLPSADH